MRRCDLALACLIAVSASVMAAAEDEVKEQSADLAPPVHVLCGGEPIEVGGFAAPFVGDFDEDGRSDLLVGQKAIGRVRIYRNMGK